MCPVPLLRLSRRAPTDHGESYWRPFQSSDTSAPTPSYIGCNNCGTSQNEEGKPSLKGRGSFQFLIKALLPMCFTKIYICIDALDECQNDRASFRCSISDLCKHTKLQTRLRIFLTGRPPVEHHVEKQLGPSFCTVALEASEEDIVKYVRKQIQIDDGGMEMSDKFTNEIINTICSTSDGM
jgi:hypothetical protein